MANVIEVVNESGQRTRMTTKRLEAVRDQGWREWTDEDRRAEAEARRRPTEVAPPTEEEIHRNGVLASVAGDPDAAAAAFEAEANRPEPDEQLLTALEAIVDGHPADDTTPATNVANEHEEA